MKRLGAFLLAAAISGTLASPVSAEAINQTRTLTELTGAPIDENGNQYSSAGETIASGQTIYFLLPEEAGTVLGNSSNIRLQTKKVQNAKLVSSVELVEKRLTTSSGNYLVPGKETVNNKTNQLTCIVPSSTRNTYIAVKLNSSAATEEQKVELQLTFTARKNATTTNGYAFKYGSSRATQRNGSKLPAVETVTNDTFMNPTLQNSGDKLVLRTVFYVGSQEEKGDAAVMVGKNGVTISPIANSDNEVIFETDSDTLATLTFRASSNPSKFFAKLSTSWTRDLLTKFADTDAVVRRFNPATIDTTSRGTLALNNPYSDTDVNPKKVYIYAVDSKGTISDVTKNFSYNAEEDTFLTKTRALGTYVISNIRITLKQPR